MTARVSLLAHLRATFRLSRVGLHLLSGACVVMCFFPLLPDALRQRIKQRWSRQLLAMLGMRVRDVQAIIPERALLVCNHISWLDIFAINAVVRCRFVCKDEVRDWPLIGWLVAATGNVFIQRGSAAAASRTLHVLGEELRREHRIVFFPEGTTTDGTRLLPFTTALFEAANMGDAMVTPLSLRYLERDGSRSAAPAYDGDISFMECMLAVARTPRIDIELRILPGLIPGLSRRDYAERSRSVIAADLGLS